MTAVRHADRLGRSCWLVALLLVLSGVFHFAVLMITGTSWSGPLSWRKPMTFGISFGLTLASSSAVLTFARARRRPRRIALTGLAVACVTEVTVITVQAWRRQPSHFGVTGPGAGLVAGSAAGGLVLLVASLILATVAAWPVRRDSAAAALAIRAGFVALLATLALGVYMLVRGMIIDRAGAGTAAAFAFTADLKPAHAVTIHGILVLPGLAWLLARGRLTARSQLVTVRVAVIGYLLLAGTVIAEALAGVDPVAIERAPVPATILAFVAVVLIAAAVVRSLAGLRQLPGGSPNPAE